MKKILLALILVFLITSCNKDTKNKEKKDIKNQTVKTTVKTVAKTYSINKNSSLLLLPEETEGIINIKSLKSVFENFMIKNNSVFGIKIEDKAIEEIQKVLAINPLNLKDIESLGIDVNKEFGIAFSDILWGKGDDLASINVISYIPLKDDKKLITTIESKFKDGKFKKDESFNLNIKKEDGYYKFFGKQPNEVLYVLIKDHYFFIIINPIAPQKALNLTKDILKGKTSLKNSKNFQELSKLSKTDSGIYFYANIEKLVDSNQVRIEKEFSKNLLNKDSKTIIEAFKTYKHISVSIGLDTNNFVMSANALIDQNSKYLSMIKNIKYNNTTILGLDKPALYFMSFGINIPEYIKLIKSFMEKRDVENFNKEMEKTNEKFGINLQSDLINNFDGNFAFATYDGMSLSTTNYNSMMTIGFKNSKLIKNLIEKLLANKELKSMSKYVNKTTDKGKTIYIINAMVTQVYLAFKDNEMIIASSKNIYDSALTSSKNTGFYKYSQKDKNLKSITDGNIVFYISFLEVIKALNNFKGMLPPEPTKMVIDVLELLDYFSVNIDMYDTSISAKYILKTNSKKLFFPATIELVKKYNK